MNSQPLPITKTKPRLALRLVGTKQLPRADWLAVRKRGIGSSDAAAAVGLNPYKSQLELWMEKTGRDETLPKIDPQDEESPAYWGNILEPIVATHYSQRSGHRVRRINAVLQHPDPTLSWMLANIDREIIGRRRCRSSNVKPLVSTAHASGKRACRSMCNYRSCTSSPSPASRRRMSQCCWAGNTWKSTGLNATIP